MKRICSSAEALASPAPAGPWLFLGKDSETRRRISSHWRGSAPHPIPGRLDAVAERLKGPFVDAVARLGRRQGGKVAWWASSFSWKHPVASDLFLLICYHELIKEVIAEPGETVFVVEDPWLRAQCCRSFPDAAASPLRFMLFLAKLRLSARALASRAAWVVRAAKSALRQNRNGFRRTTRPEESPQVLLYGLPQEFAFDSEGRWKEVFLPGLWELLSAHAIPSARLAPPAPGFEEALARLSSEFVLLSHEVGLSALVAALSLPPRPAALDEFRVGPTALPVLAEREWWTDLSTSRSCDYFLFFKTASACLQRIRPRVLVYPFENQPWEKMLVLACRASATRSIGHQHSVTPRFFLPTFLGNGEDADSPLPDLVLATGPLTRRLLVESGFSESRIKVGGSLRMPTRMQPSPYAGKHVPAGARRRVLVILCHDMHLARTLLDDLESAFPSHGADAGVEFLLRPHPTFDAAGAELCPWMSRVKGELRQQLPGFDAVLSTGSTVVVEALSHGLPVVLYRAETLIDANDMGNYLPGGLAAVASRITLRDEILAAIDGRRHAPSEPAGLAWSALFSPPEEGVWLEAIQGQPAFQEKSA